jgi:uncharacterized membrane protein
VKRQSAILRLAFFIAVAVKGIDGVIETLAGFAIAILGTQGIYSLVIQVTAPELDLHPDSRAVHLIRHGAFDLTHVASRFVILWLLVHGILKFVLAVELLRERIWIFPVAAVVLSGFVVYMTSRLVAHWSPWVLAFALFDLITVALVLTEWRAKRGRRE